MSQLPLYAAAVQRSNAKLKITALEDEIARLRAQLSAQSVSAVQPAAWTVDDLAQEIRRVDGNHSLGAGALAEALMPFLAHPADADAVDAKVPLSIPTPARVKAIAEANGGQEGECEWHFPRENLMDFAYALMTYSVDKYVAAQSTEG